jgi:hypothetical protein
MTLEETLSVAVGVLNLAVVLVIVAHVRRLGLRPPMPLVALAAVFAIRAFARIVPPLDEDPESLTIALDLVLLVVLVAFLPSLRRLVTSFVYEREALQRAQIDYDDALAHHEANVADQRREALDELDDALGRLASGHEHDAALADARAAMRTLRADG